MANHNEILMDIDLQIIDELQMEVILEKYKGDKGDPGEGFPAGGITGQVLAKRSDADYDTEWVDSGTDIIDDSAGAGDTDKAWSADKITQELDSLDPTLTESIESTAIAIFDDGADDLPLEELRVEINPVQDLHGYNKPWVGGAGANLIPDGTNTDNGYIDGKYISGSGNRFENEIFYVSEYFPVTAGAEYTLSNSGELLNSPAVVFYDENKAYISGRNFGNQRVRQVTAPDNAVYARCTQSKDFSSRIIQFEKGSTATTPTPYKNICSITGWTGVEVRDEGKNLIPKIESGQLNQTTGAEETSQSAYRTGFIKLENGKTYTLSGFLTNGNIRRFLYDAQKTYTGNLLWTVADLKYTFTANADGYLRIQANSTIFNDSTNLQCEEGSTPTPFVPFPVVYPIQFPSEAGTVYSGYLTVHKDGTGEVVADRGIVTIDGTETFIDVTSANVFYVTKDVLSSYGLTTADDYCNMFRPVSATGSSYMEDGDIARQSLSNNRLFVKSSVFAGWTASQLATYFASNNLQICLGLQESLHFDLTTTQVRTLLGYNAISADSGNVALTYRKDSEVNYELARLEEKIDSRPEIINDETVSDDSVWSSEKVDHLTTTEQETVSGDIVTFETDAEQLLEQLTVSIEPVQDLHGYGSPWVGGAGKNLAPLTVALMKEANTHGTWNGNTYSDRGLTYVVNTDDAGNVISITLSGTATSNGGFYFIPDKTYQFTIGAESKMTLNASADLGGGFEFHVNTTADTDYKILGAYASEEKTISADTYYRMRTYVARDTVISTPVTFAPMIRLATDTDATFAPYENICPITGWDGVEVTQKNLPIIYDSIGFVGGVDYVANQVYDATTGEITSVNGYARYLAFVKCTPGQTYYMSFNKSSTASRAAYVAFYNARQEFMSSIMVVNPTTATGVIRASYVAPSDTMYMRFSMPYTVADSFFLSAGVEIPEDFSVVEQTYSISFPSSAGTVYGGTLTINRDGSGSLVVDKVDKEIPTITAFSTTGDYGNGAYVDFTETLESGQAKVIAISDVVEGRAFNNRTNFCCAKSSSNSKRMIVYTNADYTVEQYNANIAGGHLVANLASPQTYSLTANQVRTLLGYNAIWADAGDVSVTYRKGSLADLTSMTNVESRTLSTLSMLAPIEFSPATSAHAVNDVFIVGDKLYRATASIAQGAEIVEGTNVEQTTIMTVLQNAWGVSF